MKYTVKWIINDPTDHKLAPVDGQAEVEAKTNLQAITKVVGEMPGRLGRDDQITFKVFSP